MRCVFKRERSQAWHMPCNSGIESERLQPVERQPALHGEQLMGEHLAVTLSQNSDGDGRMLTTAIRP